MGDRVLIVDDERDVRRLLSFNLEQAGFETESVENAAQALLSAGRFRPDVIILDLMLPDLSGVEVCRRMRQDRGLADAGVLMLTALGTDEDRILGLEVGADDYVVKPFNVREVVLRARALARRVGERRQAHGTHGGTSILRWRELSVDTVTHDTRIAGQEIALRPLEFKLLVTLLSQPGRVFTREELLAHVWDINDGGNSSTVNVHVRRLRQNLGSCAEVIETVPGFGYRAGRG
jgi:two-component system phosphate regulon response regulator PhoB